MSKRLLEKIRQRRQDQIVVDPKMFESLLNIVLNFDLGNLEEQHCKVIDLAIEQLNEYKHQIGEPEYNWWGVGVVQ
jgi:hypothetical protein